MKRIISLMLTIVMLIQLFPLSVFSADNASRAVGTPLSGKGTKNEPYIIQSADQLLYFSTQSASGNTYSGKYIELAASINLSGQTWNPIKNFAGIFCGNGYSIINVNITNDSIVSKDSNGAVHLGLFGTNNGTITDLNVNYSRPFLYSKNGNSYIYRSIIE